MEMLHSTPKLSYIKDKIKRAPIVEFVGLRPKMYSYTVCEAFEFIPGLNFLTDVRHKAMATSVAR